MNAAAPLRQIQADQLSRRLGCVVTQWYGMTEASPAIASQREEETSIPNTIGRLLPGIEMRVVDERGHGKSLQHSIRAVITSRAIGSGLTFFFFFVVGEQTQTLESS